MLGRRADTEVALAQRQVFLRFHGTEPDPPRGGHKITKGVAPDRIISLGDRDAPRP